MLVEVECGLHRINTDSAFYKRGNRLETSRDVVASLSFTRLNSSFPLLDLRETEDNIWVFQ